VTGLAISLLVAVEISRYNSVLTEIMFFNEIVTEIFYKRAFPTAWFSLDVKETRSFRLPPFGVLNVLPNQFQGARVLC
jgi:hypothetical protein